jgi:hypothetical protein
MRMKVGEDSGKEGQNKTRSLYQLWRLKPLMPEIEGDIFKSQVRKAHLLFIRLIAIILMQYSQGDFQPINLNVAGLSQ